METGRASDMGHSDAARPSGAVVGWHVGRRRGRGGGGEAWRARATGKHKPEQHVAVARLAGPRQAGAGLARGMGREKRENRWAGILREVEPGVLGGERICWVGRERMALEEELVFEAKE